MIARKVGFSTAHPIRWLQVVAVDLRIASVLVQLLMSPHGVGGDGTGLLVAPSHILSLNEIFGAGLSPGKSKLWWVDPG